MAVFADEFGAVVFFGVVAGGDVGAAVEAVFTDGIIEHRGGGKSDVGNIAAGFEETFYISFLQFFAGSSDVAADDYIGAEVFLNVCAEAFTDEVHGFFGEIDVSVRPRFIANGDAADIVGAEDVRIWEHEVGENY